MEKHIKLLIGFTTVFLGLICSSQVVFADDSLSISLSSNSAILEPMPETFATTSQTITASTTAEHGYTISIKTSGETNALVNVADSTLTIPTISLSTGQASVSTANFGYGFGFSIDGGSSFKPVPEVSDSDGDELFSTVVAGENTHTLTWGAKVSDTTPAGTYANSFAIEVVANPVAPQEYSHPEQVTFDGTNYLDTGIALFSEENVNKDFIVTFTIDEIDSSQVDLATIFSDMDESGSPYPGALFRYSFSQVRTIANANSKGPEKVLSTKTGDYVLKREANILSYSTDGGQTFTTLNDFTGFTHYFDTTATFGGAKDGNGDPFRLFKGKLSNMSIVLTEPSYYTVRYNANGGTGTVDNQALPYGVSSALTTDVFTRELYIFDHWNTKADDSGTSYQPGETVLNLAEVNGVINLYAIWQDAPKYNIVYHSNTDPEETTTEEFTYSVEQALGANTFTRSGYEFVGWNTASDNSGTFYEDEESVLNLTDEDGATINLYAIWSDENYLAEGATVFDGTNYIDTGIQLFNDANVSRDFVISFEITERLSNSSQATMMSAMDESGSPWPGMVYRVASSTNMNELVINSNSSTKASPTDRGATTTKVRIRRVGTKIYERINDGDEQFVLDMSALVHTFDSPTAFGASLKADGTPQRYFKGTLSNIKLMLVEATSVTSSEEETSAPEEPTSISETESSSISETESTENTSSELVASTTTSAANDVLSAETVSTNDTAGATDSENSNITDDTSVADSYSDPLGVAESTYEDINSLTSSTANILASVAVAAAVSSIAALVVVRKNRDDE